MRDAIARIRGDLPDGILEPQVNRVDFTEEPIGYFSAESTAMTVEQLSWFIDDRLNRRLMGIEGVSIVSRTGGVSREIRVELDPARMQSQGVTASQINLQLRAMNINAAGGRAEIAGSEQSVRVVGSALTARALGETQISLGGGRTMRLNAVATVRDQWAEQTSYGIQNGRQVVSFMIQKAKGYSDVTVYHAVQAALRELEREDPRVRYNLLFTPVKYIEMQYESSMRALIEGAVLAVVVVFLFLRDWRSTLISAIAIPLSAIPAFWFMDLLGFTLNMVTLLSLSLVAGVLVDDAIVEIENIVRHMRMGKSAYQASIDAADEIGLPVVATTFSIVAVFLPVSMMSGIIGQFFISFGLTIVVAVLISLARRADDHADDRRLFPEGEGRGQARRRLGDGPLYRRAALDAGASLEDGRIGFACFVLQIFAFATLPFTFQPNTDNDTVVVSVEMPPGVTLDQTRAVAERAAAVVRGQSDVASAFASVRAGNATIYVSLKDRGEGRDRTSTEFQRQVAPQLQRDRRRARLLPQSERVGGRDVSVLLTSSDPGPAPARRAAAGRGDAAAAGTGRAAHHRRPQAAGDHDPAAARSDGRHGRHHRRDEPGDPGRDPGRDRPGQRPLLALRPAGADPGHAQRKFAAQPLDDREHAGADGQWRLGAAPGRRRHQLRRRPVDHPAHQPGAPDDDRRRSCAGRRRLQRRARPAADAAESARGRGAARPGNQREEASSSPSSSAPWSPAPSSSSRCWCCSTKG